jgi:hypothetical protein
MLTIRRIASEIRSFRLRIPWYVDGPSGIRLECEQAGDGPIGLVVLAKACWGKGGSDAALAQGWLVCLGDGDMRHDNQQAYGKK